MDIEFDCTHCGQHLSVDEWVPWMVFAVLVGYGILRNIPTWPFVLLAPK